MLPLLVFFIAVAPLDQPMLVGHEFVHVVESGESLTLISARYGVPLQYLARLNGLHADARLAVGQSLRIDNTHIVPSGFAEGIVINIPQRMLFFFSAGDLVAHYPVGLGSSGWQTVTGHFEIIQKEENPVWDVPLSIQAEMRSKGQPVLTTVPPSQENPLGLYYLALSAPGFGIHGTNKPASIYSFQTHGCIRLHPDDIADLFPRVAVGTPVHIVYQPVLVAQDDGRLFLEVHPDIYRKSSGLTDDLTERLASFRSLLDWNAVLRIARDRDGVAIVIAEDGKR
ncbi:MAG: L,D-transpeptidase family protein [Acidobacteria bacterium]|nr:L,D-transpeptidase family protein [Acidobacteriota bacterium]